MKVADFIALSDDRKALHSELYLERFKTELGGVMDIVASLVNYEDEAGLHLLRDGLDKVFLYGIEKLKESETIQ